jgi:hypothetical protein
MASVSCSRVTTMGGPGSCRWTGEFGLTLLLDGPKMPLAGPLSAAPAFPLLSSPLGARSTSGGKWMIAQVLLLRLGVLTNFALFASATPSGKQLS